jgi:nicotinamidase-related amidase
MDRLDPTNSLVLLVDVQERLAAAMPAPSIERLVVNAGLVLDTARLLGVHAVASEQYPKGLGPTIAPLAARLEALGVAPIDKLTFDACGEPRIAAAIADRSPRAVIVAGVETHVCVFQTVRALARRGLAVHVLADAVASRTEDNRRIGLELCARAGAFVTSAEAVVFDWLERAGSDSFRAVSKLVTGAAKAGADATARGSGSTF